MPYKLVIQKKFKNRAGVFLKKRYIQAGVNFFIANEKKLCHLNQQNQTKIFH